MNTEDYEVIEEGKHKTFSQHLYNEADSISKNTGIELFSQLGCKCVDSSERYKDGDLLLITKTKKLISIETEKRFKSWRRGRFPYDTIHYPPRKAKMNVDYFLTFSEDMNHALVIKGSIVRNEDHIDAVDTINHMSKQKTIKERFTDVPIPKATELELVDEKWKIIRRAI